MKERKKEKLAQSCLTLCDPMDCSPPGSSVYGIFQARILEWVAIFFSRGSSQPRDWTQVSHIVGRCFTIWATREAPENLPMKKSPGQNVFMGECYLTFKEDSIPILKFFQKFLEGTLPNSCCETLLPWHQSKKMMLSEMYRLIFLMNIDEKMLT